MATPPFFGPLQRLAACRRPLPVALGGLAILVVSFFIGVGISRLRQSLEPEPIGTSALPGVRHLTTAPTPAAAGAPARAAAPIAPPTPGLAPAEGLDRATAAATVAAAAPASLAPPDTVLLSVTVSPPHAVVMIGEERMPSNPFIGRFPRSADTQRIRATAPGFQSREREVSFKDNVILDLSLAVLPVLPGHRERLPRPTFTPPRRSLAAAFAPPPPSRENHPSPRRGIESRDPYLDDGNP